MRLVKTVDSLGNLQFKPHLFKEEVFKINFVRVTKISLKIVWGGFIGRGDDFELWMMRF